MTAVNYYFVFNIILCVVTLVIALKQNWIKEEDKPKLPLVALIIVVLGIPLIVKTIYDMITKKEEGENNDDNHYFQ